MNVINCILAYPKSSPNKGIMFSRHGHLDFEGYVEREREGENLNSHSCD